MFTFYPLITNTCSITHICVVRVPYSIFTQCHYLIYRDMSYAGQPIKIKLKCSVKETEHLDTFLFFRPSLNGVIFPMFCLLVERECQILVLKYY